jgi:hypothetical protein
VQYGCAAPRLAYKGTSTLANPPCCCSAYASMRAHTRRLMMPTGNYRKLRGRMVYMHFVRVGAGVDLGSVCTTDCSTQTGKSAVAGIPNRSKRPSSRAESVASTTVSGAGLPLCRSIS